MHLRGTLCLSRLENVTDVEDARRAKLKCKESLDSLVLEWSRSRETEFVVLDMLQPHTKVKKLTIKSYAGKEFSSWVGSSLFSNMAVVHLEKCNNCLSLPPLGQLPHLKELYIRGMNEVESVGTEFYGECIFPFPLLETLEFVNMKHWKVWLPFQLDHGGGVFPCLKRLSIKRCSKLEGKLPENLDLLAELEIFECEELVVSIANYKQLRQINIEGCKTLVDTAAKVEFELLESLCVSNISELMALQTGELLKKGFTKVRKLKINGCEELEVRLLQQLTSHGRLEIEDNSPLVEELGKEAEELLQLQILECKIEYLELHNCENLLKLPKGLNQLSSLQKLYIYKCSRLTSFPDVGLPPSLKDIHITACNSLIYFAKFQIPQNLRRIEIGWCKSLKSLVDEEAVGSSWSSSSHSCLEYLFIYQCESLTSLSLSGQLLRTLKHFRIYGCAQLELIAEDGFFRDNTNYCLEYVNIWNCQNLKSLLDGLCHLSNLKKISISGCEKLEALPEDMHNLNSLKELSIDYREGLTFPPNLTLHRLTSLRCLSINGKDPDMVSFPPDMVQMETLLPKSLTNLRIYNFPNLKKLSSKGFQFLTSLQSLQLWNCPKLASIPEEGLPPSLNQLCIYGSPVLKERCQPGKGRYWHKISHIPCIDINLTALDGSWLRECSA